MLLWKFATCVDHKGNNDVQSEIDSYDDYGREAFKRAVAHLAVTPKHGWNEPHSKKLKNEDPIYEIRYQANHRSTRALGYFAADGETFTITNCCYHKGRIYTPRNAFDQAHKRVQEIEQGRAHTVPLQVDGEDFPQDAG